MKLKALFLTILVSVILLAGCQQAKSAQSGNTANTGQTNAGASAGGNAPDGAPRGLDSLNRLALGTFKLEGTENAVTAAQAAKLLPLWKMLQGDTLKSEAERDAVVKQIETQMTEAQRAAIEAMGLTFEDMRTWMQEQGIEMPAPAAGQGGPGDFGNMTEEERTKMREQFQNMTPEERSTAMAESGFQPPAGGQGDFQPPAGGQGDFQPPADGQGNFQPPANGQGGRPGGMRSSNVLLEPLIALLTTRAGE